MSDKAANRFTSQFVLLGIVCLFIAMALGLANVVYGGSTLGLLVKVFGFLWLPLIGIGAVMRIADQVDPAQSQESADDSADSNT